MPLRLFHNTHGFCPSGLHAGLGFLLALALILRRGSGGGGCHAGRFCWASSSVFWRSQNLLGLLVCLVHLYAAFLLHLLLMGVQGFQALMRLTDRLGQAMLQFIELVQHALAIHHACIAADKSTAAADNQFL